MSALFAFFTPGTWQLIIIAFIAMLLFGNRLPGAMRNMGKGITEFKKGMQGLDDDEDEPAKKKNIPEEPVK